MPHKPKRPCAHPACPTLVGLVRAKKNVILQGAPGVGKTYAAKRLAYSMMGVKDQEQDGVVA